MPALYIHIPFCVQKCAYCDFLSFEGANKKLQQKYVEALVRELEILKNENLKNNISNKIETVFIGGGTPSMLYLGGIQAIMHAVFCCFNVAKNAEITIETNPATVGIKKFKEYKNSKINRISIGAQSFDNTLLETINRAHQAKDVSKAIWNAKKAGFSNINLDIMFGLPKQTINKYKTTLNKAISLKPTHISAYSLIIEKSTKLSQKIESGELVLPEVESEYQMQLLGEKILENAGFKKYETANYAKQGSECKHNLVYWNSKEYFAAGLGATASFIKNNQAQRTVNTNDLETYFNMINSEKLPIQSTEIISQKDQIFDYIMMGLRLVEGICFESFEKKFNIKLDQYFENAIKINLAKKLLEIKTNKHGGQTLTLSKRGFEIQNTVLLCFLD